MSFHAVTSAPRSSPFSSNVFDIILLETVSYALFLAEQHTNESSQERRSKFMKRKDQIPPGRFILQGRSTGRNSWLIAEIFNRFDIDRNSSALKFPIRTDSLVSFRTLARSLQDNKLCNTFKTSCFMSLKNYLIQAVCLGWY